MGRKPAVCTMGGAIIRRFALFPMMLLMLLLLPAGMAAQKAASSSKYIATYESSTQTLTFKKFVGETLPSNSVVVENGNKVFDITRKLGIENKTIVHIVFDKSFNTYTPTSLYQFFTNLRKLKTIKGLEYLNTERVKNMSSMFSGCSSLTSLDVTKFNTTNVTDMGEMFRGCAALTLLDVTKFNTANVKSMGFMFYGCRSLTSLKVTNLNTANVTNMNSMFYGCSSLTSLNVTSLNTSNVTDMNSMFYGCSSLTSLNVTSLNTSNVTNMQRMFASCTSLTSLDVTNFNTENVTSMSGMFDSCSGLVSLDVTNFNTANVTDMSDMFYGCYKLKEIYVSDKFVTDDVISSAYMFMGCNSLSGDIDWKSVKVSNKTYAKTAGGYFRDKAYDNRPWVKYADGTLTFRCGYKKTWGENEYALNSGEEKPAWNTQGNNITRVVFDASFANAKPTSCYAWFQDFKNLTQIEGIENLNTANVTDMNGMFKGCSNLAELDVTHFNTANVTNMNEMFSDCQTLTTIYVSDEFVTTNITNGNGVFSSCSKLKGAIDKYDGNKTDHTYANYKTGYFTKLVGKNGDEKIGAVGKTLATDNLTLADDKDFVAYEPFTAKAASYSRPVKEGTTWATLCLPFEVSLADKNFRAFKLLSADEGTETVELEEIETNIEAGTPVIIKMKDGETKLDFTVANKEITNEVKPVETANGNYQLQGLYTQKEFSKDTDNNCYIVKGDKLMNPAKLLGTSTKSVGSKPFRAYMVDNSSAPAAGARMFSISVGGSTTAIEQLETTADSKAEYYDLQGRRLQNLQKGVNIVKRGGKTMKVIIK